MAKTLSPEEATVMIIRRRLQQAQAAKQPGQTTATEKRKKGKVARTQGGRSGR